MMYTLDELLMKMGAPETREKGQMRWHYFDRQDENAGGFAEVRLLDGGATLVAEMRQWRAKDHEGDDIESLYLHARRSGNHYAVTKISFDGEDYAHPQKPIIELGLSIFHARALDISILMVEQAFNRDDIVYQPQQHAPEIKHVSAARKPQPLRAQNWGIVVPFRPRPARGAFSMG